MKEVVYKFKGIEGLYCDLKGNFFFKGKPLSKIYNNGTLAIRIGKTKRGLKKLRTLAFKTTIDVQEQALPF